MISILIKESLRTKLKVQPLSFLLVLFASRFLMFPNLVLNSAFDYYNYLFVSFLPYIFVLMNFVETGFNTESFFFDGMSVFRKELYRRVLYSKLVIYLISTSVVLLVDMFWGNDKLLSLSIFLVSLFVSIIDVFNYAHCDVRWDIMLKYKHKSKTTLFSYLSVVLLILFGFFLYLLITKYGKNLHLIFILSLGVIILLISPFILRSVVRKVQKNRYKLMQGFRGQ